MDLRSVTAGDLILKTKELVREERRITTEILHCLRETERRRLYSEKGYSSLHEYCVKELGYSASSAFRRVEAMRLIKDVPEVETKLKEGTLSLSNAATLQNFFRAEQKILQKTYTKEQKQKLVASLENKSSRECEKTLRAISPLSLPQESVRAVTETDFSVKLSADKAFMEKLQRFQNLTAHKLKSTSLKETFELALELALKAVEPKQPMTRSTSVSDAGKTIPTTRKISRYIPVEIKRAVWSRDQGRCCFVDPLSKRRCEAKRYLEFDHIQPLAFGGRSVIENLRLLCSAHNKTMAVRNIGSTKMKGYLRCLEDGKILLC